MSRSRGAVFTASLMLVAGLAACGGGDDSTATASEPVSPSATTTPATTPATTTPATSAPSSVEIDDADFGWGLNGDGAARSGGVDLELAGAYEVSDDAVSFDGYTGHAATAGSSPLDSTASFTLTAWVNYAAPSSFTVVAALLGADSYAAALAIDETGRWQFATKTEDRTGVEHAVLAEGGQATAGTLWTHLAGVHDAAAGETVLYVNGVAGTTHSTPPLFHATGPLTVGRGQFDGGPGNFWKGAIGDVAAFQRALSADEVADLRATTKPSSLLPPPVAAPDPSTYGNGILNGTWDYVYTDDEAQPIIADFSAFVDDADEVIVRIGFDDHEVWIGFLFDGVMPMYGSSPEGAAGTFTIEDDTLIIDEGFGFGVTQFALDGDSLTLTPLEWCEGLGADQVCTDDIDPLGRLVVEHEFTRSSDDPRHYDR